MAFRVDDFGSGRVTYRKNPKLYKELIDGLPECLVFEVDHDWSRENCNASADSCTIAFGIEHAYPWLDKIAVDDDSIRFTLPTGARVAVPTPQPVRYALHRQDMAIEGSASWDTGKEWFQVPCGVRDVSDHKRLAAERRAYEAKNPERRKGPDAKYEASLAERSPEEQAKRERRRNRTKGRGFKGAGGEPPVNRDKKIEEVAP